MNRNKLFINYSEATARINRGDYWFSQVQQLINPKTIILYATGLKVWLPQLSYEGLLIIVGSLGFITFIIKWILGFVDEKLGLWKKQSEYSAKKEHLNPVYLEMRKTLENIAKKVNAISEFKDL